VVGILIEKITNYPPNRWDEASNPNPILSVPSGVSFILWSGGWFLPNTYSVHKFDMQNFLASNDMKVLTCIASGVDQSGAFALDPLRRSECVCVPPLA